ncbi:MAG: hypothetical protein VST68_04950, partial [Nitrospirota bacterium]|nr:hypothetical protein [Nitrospirota bacterium]
MGTHSPDTQLVLSIMLMVLLMVPITISQAIGYQGDDLGPLKKAKIYLAAGDYRRAVKACQEHLDRSPSVEAY